MRDADGNIIPNAEDRVTFKVEGNGELVGVDNGSAPDHDSYKGNNKRALSGKVLAIVRATKEAGEFTVTASADGLKSSKVTVKLSLIHIFPTGDLGRVLPSRVLRRKR